jgi:hypothetical protein
MAAAMQLARAQPGPIQRFSVEDRRLHILGGPGRDGLDEASRIDDKLLIGQGNSSLGE